MSVRVDERSMLVRCRGPRERGLLFTEPEDIRLVPIGPLKPPPEDGYSVPNELAIHTALYLARPEVGAVVHAHPLASLLCGLAGLELRPVFGAYNIPAARLAVNGVPVFPRAALITRAELAHELVETMGGSSACLMRGHGITTCGAGLQGAVVRALDLDALASVTDESARLGAAAPVLTAASPSCPSGSRFRRTVVFAYTRLSMPRQGHCPTPRFVIQAELPASLGLTSSPERRGGRLLLG